MCLLSKNRVEYVDCTCWDVSQIDYKDKSDIMCLLSKNCVEYVHSSEDFIRLFFISYLYNPDIRFQIPEFYGGEIQWHIFFLI